MVSHVHIATAATATPLSRSPLPLPLALLDERADHGAGKEQLARRQRPYPHGGGKVGIVGEASRILGPDQQGLLKSHVAGGERDNPLSRRVISARVKAVDDAGAAGDGVCLAGTPSCLARPALALRTGYVLAGAACLSVRWRRVRGPFKTLPMNV